MKLNCVCLFLVLAFASTNASYTHQESNEDEKSTFNVVSTHTGGMESSRRHVSTNLELEPSYPYPAGQQGFGNAVVAPHQHHHHHHHHHGHNYPHGAHCSHPTDLTSSDHHGGHGISSDINNPRGHDRLVDPVSGAGLLDVRNGVRINSRTATGGQNRPVTYPQEMPSYPPAYPSPHDNYPPTGQQSHPSYPTPMHGYNYPDYPAPRYPNYPPPSPSGGYAPGAYQYGGNHDHGSQHNHQHAGLHSHGYGGPRDHWDHTFKMSTEYKEDGVHKGPTHALTNNGYGFGSGYGGGYNGAFNRPGF